MLVPKKRHLTDEDLTGEDGAGWLIALSFVGAAVLVLPVVAVDSAARWLKARRS